MALRWPTWVLGGLLVALLAVGVRLLLRPRAEPPAAVASDRTAPARVVRARDGRIPIPRLRAVAPPPPPESARGPRLEGGRGRLYDRRPEPGPESESQRAQLRERLHQVDDAVEDCLARWERQDRDLAAGVLLVFALDAGGLQQVWIEDHPRIEEGPLRCLSEAIYGVAWAGLVREPVELSRRMRTRSDAGPPRGRVHRLLPERDGQIPAR